MADRVEAGGLSIAANLHDFINQEALAGTGIAPEHFWNTFAAIVDDLALKNIVLLKKRDALQAKIDAWYREHRGEASDPAAIDLLREVRSTFLPQRVVAFADPDTDADADADRVVLPVLTGRGPVDGTARAFVCRHSTCSLPLLDSSALQEELRSQ